MKFGMKWALASSTACAALALGSIGVANAQDLAGAGADYEETVVVTGIRGSLQRSREIERNASGVQDTIVAEDIASFPDLNLAEAIQRLPGVAINREAGEGRRISLRGLGSDFTRVQLNGMEVLGNVDSPQDSRGQTTRDRAFDFNIFASELFTRVDVYKSFAAAQDEGGLAGTVGLYTAHPFDYDGFQGAISGQVGTNTFTEDTQPRIAGLLSNNWGNFGALVSVAYSSRETEEQGSNTYRWRPFDNAQGSDISNLSQTDQDAINSGELRWARGNRYSVWASEQERLGITGALQWRPTDTIELTFDALYGNFKADRDELHLATRGGGSSGILDGGATVAGVSYGPAVINEIRYNENGEVVYADVSDTNFATETRRQETENTFQQFVLSGDWEVSDRLTVSGLIGTEKSDYDIPISDKFYTEAYGGLIADYTIDRFYLHNTYDWGTTDPANFRAHEIDFSETYQSSEFDNAELDFAYDLLDAGTLRAGLSYKQFTNSGFSRNNDNVLRSDWQSGAVDDDISQYARVFSDHDNADWIIVDFDAALQGFGVTRDGGAENNIFEVEEETVAAYVQYDFDTALAGMNLRGNAGLRYYDSEVTSSGEADVGFVTAVGEYDGVLPAVNLVLEVNDGFQLRAAASKNINRPSLGALAVNGSISIGDGDAISVSIGNPSLSPYESVNLDLAAEWYFGDSGSFAVGAFYKDIDGFITTETATNVPFSATGLATIPGVSPTANVVEFTRPVNSSGSEDLTGLEISGQTDLFFLPAPFDNLGVFGNVTFIDGDFEGLSDTNANISLFYENEIWGARVSANYRSEYVHAGAIGDDQDEDGFHATTYVDASAFYQINDIVKLTFDAINLTDEREEQYSDSDDRLYNTTQSGTTYLVGASVKF